MKSYSMLFSHIKILPILYLFLYVYPQFIGGNPISTRVAFGIVGFLYFLFHRFVSLRQLAPLKGLAPILVVSVLTAIGNITYEFEFAKYTISMTVIFFASYLFVQVLKKSFLCNDRINFVLVLFVWVVLLQSLITLLMFFFPPLFEFLNSIFPNPGIEKTNVFEIRFIGLGTAFFGAGVINGLALIVISYLYIAHYIKPLSFWVAAYSFILIIGMMMARTTIIGLIISLLFIITGNYEHIHKLFKYKVKWLLYLTGFLFAGLFLAFAYIEEDILRFGLEFFYNYSQTGTFESASTNELQTMYRFPADFKTWIIGDGLFNVQGHYYMKTDVGYLRLLYYGGLPMVFAFFYFPWYIISKIRAFGISKSLNSFLTVLYLYVLILNFKGLVDINYFLFLIYMVLYARKSCFKLKQTKVTRLTSF